MPGAILEPMPVEADVISGPKNLRMAGAWINWLSLVMLPRLQQAPPLIVTVKKAAQSAALGTTVLVGAANAGMYQITIWTRVVTADNVGSSLTVTVRNTDGAIACTQTGTVLNTNDVTKPIGQVFVVRADAGSVISFSTAYATTGGAPAMVYDCEVRVISL